MAFYRNASPHQRVWPHLTNAQTGTTLELAAGEVAEVVMSSPLNDPYLVPAPPPDVVAAHPAKGAKGAKETDPPADVPAPAPEEE